MFKVTNHFNPKANMNHIIDRSGTRSYINSGNNRPRKPNIFVSKKMIKISQIFFLYIVVGTTSVYAIECKLAKSYSEITICNDQRLIALDDAMNKNYKYMINSNIGNGARQALRSTQRIWILQRDKCQDEICIIDAYINRIDEICEYPVIGGIHPVCVNSNEILNLTNQVRK